MMFLSLLLYIKMVVSVAGYPAYLLVPDHEPHDRLPVVYVMHDHGGYYPIGKEKMASPIYRTDWDEEQNLQIAQFSRQWVDRLYGGMYVADSLAKDGYIVFIPDSPCWGENESEYYDESDRIWANSIVDYDRQALDWLYAQPMVDTTRIVTFGLSMGAYRAWMLAAWDDRIKACAAFNWMTTIPSMKTWSLPYAKLRTGEEVIYPLKAAEIAPRPFLLVAGRFDHLFPIEDVRTCRDIIRKSYEEKRSTRNFEYVEHPIGHLFTDFEYNQFSAWLRKIGM